jgi:diadenosine tetraphosphate (Ap4A) HIT family hydrolase
MLMMVDPNAHFHVIPRYPDARNWSGIEFRDEGWPGPPSLKSAVELGPERSAMLRDELRPHFLA